jgi:hypothetical protein
MNNEPVAIVNTNCENNIQWYEDNPKKHNGYFLYINPIKELTEWEIKECWEEATEMQEHFCSQYFDFAQLILRKAQEK